MNTKLSGTSSFTMSRIFEFFSSLSVCRNDSLKRHPTLGKERKSSKVTINLLTDSSEGN